MTTDPIKEEAEWKLIYSAIVAGKSARFAEGVMGRLEWLWSDVGVFDGVRQAIKAGDLETVLREARSGSYTRLTKCLAGLVEIEALTATVEKLETIHGIGPKTARFFVMWSREGQRYAALDTHVLKYLRELGHDAPKSTPQAGPVYRRLEQAFIAEADRQGKTPRELDYEVWDRFSNRQQLALNIST